MKVLDCPYCHAPMEPGEIRSHEGPLNWVSERPQRFRLSDLFGRGETIASGLFGGRTRGWRCQACRKIIIEA